jgi:aminocarboxymuconate-semialdehyde decarboxylase
MSMDAILLDVHAHLIPIDADALAAFDGVQWDAAARRLMVDGHAIGMAALFDPAALITWMDAERIEQAWISVPPPVYRPHLDEATALQWARYLNDGLRAIAEASGNRLRVLQHVPLDHPDAACTIVDQAATTHDELVAGYAASTTLPGSTLADARLAPVWAALDRQSAFVFLHPGECCDERLEPFYLQNLLGNPHETAVAAGALVFGGVLERYERIRFCLAHGGGTVPAVAGRWQRGYDTARPGVDTARAAPRALLRRLWVDCIMHDDAALHCACATFGENRMVFGSDWPFPMGLNRPGEQLSALPPASQRRIFSGNVRALLDAAR